MRDREGVVLIAAREVDRPVRPEPPEDLWEKLDGLVEENRKENSPQPPEGSFTAYEYAARKKYSVGNARKILLTLVNGGKLKVVRLNSKAYYTFVK